MDVLLLCGKAESGKDTVAGIVKQVYEEKGKKVLIIHYADLLKFICKQYLGWDGKKDEAGRKMLQYVGTEVFRNIDKNFWVSFVVMTIKALKSEWDLCIIPDCRFKNEVFMPIKAGFDVKTVRVIRDGHTNRLTDEQASHPSETELDDFAVNYEIHNAGNIADLTEEVRKMLERINYDHKEN